MHKSVFSVGYLEIGEGYLMSRVRRGGFPKQGTDQTVLFRYANDHSHQVYLSNFYYLESPISIWCSAIEHVVTSVMLRKLRIPRMRPD